MNNNDPKIKPNIPNHPKPEPGKVEPKPPRKIPEPTKEDGKKPEWKPPRKPEIEPQE